MSAKKKRKKLSSLYIFPVLFVIICLSYIIRLLFFHIETTVVKYDTLENDIPVQALIDRIETVTSLPAGAKMNCKVNDGDRVAFGEKLLEIVKSSGVDENISIKIKELNDRIAEIQKSNEDNNFFSQDKERIESSIAANATQIKQLSKSGDLGKLGETKDNLEADLYEKSLIYGSDSFAGKNLEQLTQEKTQLESLYKNNLDAVYAQNSGIVCFELDGYEQVLNPANIKNFKLKNIKEIMAAISSKKSSSNKNDPTGVKVVDNFEWYISSVMKSSEIGDLKAGKTVTLSFPDLDKAEVKGVVVSVSSPENGEVLVNVRINENVNNFYKNRLVKVDIIKDNYEGFEVPTKALVTKDNKTGVYVIRSGVVRFIPVDILTTDGDNTLVQNLDDKEQGNAAPPVLKVFDEVITTTKMVKENQIITDNI